MIVTQMPENTLVSLRTLLFFLSTGNKYLFLFQHHLIPVTLDQYTCFDFLMSGVKISQPKFLIYTSFGHRFQSLIIGHRDLQVNFHVIQFQYGLEFLRLSYSQNVQTLQNIR